MTVLAARGTKEKALMPKVYQRATARRDLMEQLVYLSRPDGVSIVRVLHAARDWWSVLSIDD